MSITLDRYELKTEGARVLVAHNDGCDGRACELWFMIDCGMATLGAHCPKCGEIPIRAIEVPGLGLLIYGPLAASTPTTLGKESP